MLWVLWQYLLTLGQDFGIPCEDTKGTATTFLSLVQLDNFCSIIFFKSKTGWISYNFTIDSLLIVHLVSKRTTQGKYFFLALSDRNNNALVFQSLWHSSMDIIDPSTYHKYHHWLEKRECSWVGIQHSCNGSNYSGRPQCRAHRSHQNSRSSRRLLDWRKPHCFRQSM